WAHTALKLSEEKKLTEWRVLWLLSRVYLEYDDDRKAMEYCDRALETARSTKNEYGQRLVEMTKGEILLRCGTRPGDAESDRDQNISLAIKLFRQTRDKVAEEALFLKAYCTLRLVRAYLKHENLGMGFEEFSLWQNEYAEKVEHAWMHEKASRLN